MEFVGVNCAQQISDVFQALCLCALAVEACMSLNPLIAAVAVVRCGSLPAPSAGISFVRDFAGAHRRCARPHRGDGIQGVVGSRDFVGKPTLGR